MSQNHLLGTQEEQRTRPPPPPSPQSPTTAGNLNGDSLRLVELYCSACARNTGTTLAFPLAAAGGFAGGGAGVSFSLPLSEAKGWVKDPENSLKEASAPTKCEMAEVLSNLSELRILGGEDAAGALLFLFLFVWKHFLAERPSIRETFYPEQSSVSWLRLPSPGALITSIVTVHLV